MPEITSSLKELKEPFYVKAANINQAMDSQSQMSRTADLEDLLFEVDNKLSQLRTVDLDIGKFETSCTQTQLQIQVAATTLIDKIKNHESRLLEEIDTRRQTEIKRFTNMLFDLNEYIKTLESVQKKGYAAIQEETMDNIYDECIATLNDDAVFHNNILNDFMESDFENNMSMPILSFVPIKSNTAFGSIGDNITKRNSQSSRIQNYSISGHSRSTDTLGSELTLCRSNSQSVPDYLQVSITTDDSHLDQCDSEGGLYPTLRRVSSVGYNIAGRRASWSLFPQALHKRSNSCRKMSRSLGNETSNRGYGIVKTLWNINNMGCKPGQINCPSGVAFLPEGYIIVADKHNESIQVFDTQGKYHSTIGKGKIKPHRLCVTQDGKIAVTDSRDACVKLFDIQGHLVSTFGRKRFKSTFKCPCGIAVTSQGQFVVSDLEKHCVTLHQPDGKLIHQLQTTHFQSPQFITTDHADNIIVCDSGTQSVKVFDKSGQFKLHFSHLSDDSQLKFPNGVCVDEAGHILVADWGSHNVSLFSPKGQFLHHVVTRQHSLHHPADIAINQRHLVVTEYSEEHSAIRMYELPD